MNKLYPLGLSVVLLAGASAALSEEAASLNLAGLKFTPKLEFSQYHIDNLFYSPDDEVSSMVSVIKPSWQLSAGEYKYNVSLDQEIEAGFYSESEDDNYVDHNLSINAFLAPTSKHRLSTELNVSHGHEDRGVTRGEFQADSELEEPNQLKRLSSRLLYILGNEASIGRVHLGLSSGRLSFSNNEIFTAVREHDDRGVHAEFFWNISEKTDLIAGTDLQSFDYDVENSRDSDQKNYFVGMSWQGTAKTRGSFRVGNVSRSFSEADGRDDFSGNSWSANMRWMPRTYSTFMFETSKTVKETYSDGDFIDESRWLGSWKHGWSDRYSTTLSFVSSSEDFIGSLSNREDDAYLYILELDYQLRRWVSLGMHARRQTRDSTVDNFDYTRHKLGVSLELSL